jgi:hypothetical protein
MGLVPEGGAASFDLRDSNMEKAAAALTDRFITDRALYFDRSQPVRNIERIIGGSILSIAAGTEEKAEREKEEQACLKMRPEGKKEE